MPIQIRRATPRDAEMLAALATRTFSDTFTGTCTAQDMQDFLAEYFNADQVNRELADPDDYFFLAEMEGLPVGYVRMKEDYSAFPLMKQWRALELKRIYVDQPFHGKGVAQALMQFVEDFARFHAFEVVWLGVWEHNNRAKAFYLKSGFADSGHTHEFPIGQTPQTDNWLWKFLK